MPNLDKEIYSNFDMGGKSYFVVFYFLSDNPDGHNGPLYISRYDKSKGYWENANVPPEASGKSVINFHKFETLDFNYLIPHKNEGFFIANHIDTPEEKFVVLSDDLKLLADTQGKYIGALDANHVLYKSILTIGSLNKPATIFLRDLQTDKDIQIYPRKPYQHPWLDYVKQEKTFIGTHPEQGPKDEPFYDPCVYMEKNSYKRFFYDSSTQSLAFLVIFNNAFPNNGPATNSNSPTTVVAIYRNIMDEKEMKYREVKPEELLTQFGSRGSISLLDGILANPEDLKLIFEEFVR